MSPALRSGLASLPDARLDGGEEGTRRGDPWGRRELEEGRGDEGSESSSWGMVASHLLTVNSNLQLIRMARVHANEIWGKWKDAKGLGVLEGCGKAVEKWTIANPVGAQGSRCGEWIACGDFDFALPRRIERYVTRA